MGPVERRDARSGNSGGSEVPDGGPRAGDFEGIEPVTLPPSVMSVLPSARRSTSWTRTEIAWAGGGGAGVRRRQMTAARTVVGRMG